MGRGLLGDSTARSSRRFLTSAIVSADGAVSEARSCSSSRPRAPYFAPAMRCFSARSELPEKCLKTRQECRCDAREPDGDLKPQFWLLLDRGKDRRANEG